MSAAKSGEDDMVLMVEGSDLGAGDESWKNCRKLRFWLRANEVLDNPVALVVCGELGGDEAYET